MEVLVPNDKYRKTLRETFFLHLDHIYAEMVSQLFPGRFSINFFFFFDF